MQNTAYTMGPHGFPQVLSSTQVGDHVVHFLGEKPADEFGHVEFVYDVHFSSYSCDVTFTYMPIDDGPEEDGRIGCDVDVHGGGDCVGVPKVQECIGVAWGVHEGSGVAARFRMTDG